MVMASKRSISFSASSSGSQPKQAKRQVSVATFQKWQLQQEKKHKTLTWLCCDKQQRYVESFVMSCHRIHSDCSEPTVHINIFRRELGGSLTFGTC